MAELNKSDALLVFRVGPVHCCAPAGTVEAVVLPPKLTRLPGASAAEPGMFRHGGALVRVIDLRECFGIDPGLRDATGRLIIVGLRAGRVGYWVDAIGDVLPMPESGWCALPPQLPREVFTRAWLHKAQITLYTEFERMQGLQAAQLAAHIAALQAASPSASAGPEAALRAPAVAPAAAVVQLASTGEHSTG